MKPTRLGCLLVLVLVGSNVAVHGQATTSKDRRIEPFLLSGVNPCTGESVELVGEIVVTTHVTTNGTLHATLTLVPRSIVGYSQGGVMYRAVGGHHEHFNASGGATFTQVDIFHMVSQGADDNFSSVILTSVIVDGNGITRVETSLVRSECRG